MTPILPARFWSYVDKTETCWLWTGVPNSRGYGLFGLSGKRWYAHRLSYSALVGAIPDEMQIDHRCRVKLCVRPEHLHPVTAGVNMQNRGGAQKNSRSGVRGVHPFQGKWRVQVKAPDGKIHSGGVWSDLDHAEIAAQNLRMDLMTNNLADDW